MVLKNYMNNYDFVYTSKTQEEYEIDKIITKKTMTHLQHFFSKKYLQPTTKSNKVLKNKKTKKNKTQKIYY